MFTSAWLSRQPRFRLAPAVVGLLFACALVLPHAVGSSAQSSGGRQEPTAGIPSAAVIRKATAAEQGWPEVKVALHVQNVYGLSLIDESFLADGWYSLEWGPDVQSILDRTKIDPSDLVTLANEIALGENSARSSEPTPQSLLPPGHFGRVFHFSGKFQVRDVPQRFAPFDHQPLPISLEVRPLALGIAPDQVRLEPANKATSLLGEHVRVSGYDLDAVSWERLVVVYPDDYRQRTSFSRVTAVFDFGKNEWAMFLKWVFPVLIVMAIVIVSPSIEGALGDVRLAIPPGALLTLVVMHDGYKNSFPPSPFLTYLDELYIYSYILCLAIFLLFLVGANLVSRASEQDRALVSRRVNRIDTAVQLTLLAGFVLVGVVGWFT